MVRKILTCLFIGIISFMIGFVEVDTYNFYNANYELSKCQYLYILGYNMNSNDNHINSILHEFICKNNKKIIYFYYVRKNKIFDEEKTINEINKSLKIKNNAYDIKIDIVELRDDPNIVIDRIRKDCY